LTRTRLHDAARAVQIRLEQFYALERGPDVTGYIRVAEDGERETLLVRSDDDAVELSLSLPQPSETKRGSLDRYLQVVEGVSHFVYVAERARVALPATALELELQAEVDKLLVLGGAEHPSGARARELHRRLYDGVRFLHAEGTEEGQRYRLANRLAARLWQRLFSRGARTLRPDLRRFYRAGQADKIRAAAA
jgi:hypothetical protein